MRIADIFLAVPRVILALAMAQALGPSLPNMMALTVTYWPWFTIIVATETRSVKKTVFVEATEALGVGSGHALWPYPAQCAVVHYRAQHAEHRYYHYDGSRVGFLGMGAQPPAPEWGAMIAEARLYLPDAWWYALAPGLAIFFVVMGFNVLGDACATSSIRACAAVANHARRTGVTPMSVLDINDLVVDFHTDDGLVQAIDRTLHRACGGNCWSGRGERLWQDCTVARCILGVLPRPPAQIRAGEVRFQGQDLLHAPEAALTARVRGKAITFIPQDPQASLNPLFPVGVQLRDLLAWGTQKRCRTRQMQEQIVTLLQQVQIPTPTN